MGILASLFWSPEIKTNDPDPVTGFTSMDKHLIKVSWAEVRKDATKNGVALLSLFLTKFPKEKHYFPFKDVPTEDLVNDKKFHAHAASVMYAFSSIVDSIDDSELLVNILVKIGENHKRRQLTAQSMNNLRTVMLELFGQIMSKDQAQAWDKVSRVAFDVICKQL